MSSTICGLAAGMILLSLFHLPAGDQHLVKCRVYEVRQSENDLEVGGEIDGVPPGASRFIPYSELLKLPQVAFSVSNDVNFSGKTEIKGIPLDRLAQSLGARTGAKLVVAICYDGYQAVYPAAYLASHHPVLVLKVNGRTQSDWPKSLHGGSLGPYLISQPSFTPSYKVLSHAEEQQIPFGVTRIVFRDEKTVLGSIAPRGTFAADSPVTSGYRIAQQNCFRCHNMGAEGGQMAGRTWQTLGMWAATEPKYFTRYVKNPQSIDPKNRMPGFPGYDAATIEALRQYFASFDGVGKPGGVAMMLKGAKTLLILALALFYTVVVFNNVTDYNSNYLFVYHVLDMDSTFPGNQGMWRAVHSSFVYHLFYNSIISWETLTAVLLWSGGWTLARRIRSTASAFNLGKRIAIAGLTLSLLMWFIAFLTVGAEWFLMWQSKIWNGQEAAFRMFTIVGIVLVLLAMPDVEEQA